jgi:hypothetical protein
MKNARVIYPAHQPRPFEHDPTTIEEDDALDRWRLGLVEDDVDDSLAFIARQLLAMGLTRELTSGVLQRIKAQVFRIWAERVLYGYRDCPLGAEKFLEAKFGPSRPVWPPHRDGS